MGSRPIPVKLDTPSHEHCIIDTLFFLARFLRNPGRIASVVPSSRQLCRAMFAEIELADGDLVIEYGPGTGAFTAEIARLRRSGRDIRYLGIERDAAMCRFLARRYPDLDIVCADVADVAALHAGRALPAARAIVSGLPLILMDDAVVEQILDASRRCLRPDGVFRTFTYLHCFPTRGAARLRARIDRHFDSAAVSRPVLFNLPPALVLSGWPTAAARRAHGARETQAADSVLEVDDQFLAPGVSTVEPMPHRFR